MKTRIATAALGTLLFTAFANASEPPHWTYQGKTGTSHWAGLEADYAVCGTGQRQSPINIETRKVTGTTAQPIGVSYAPARAEVINNGHTVQVEPANGGTLTIDGVEYKLAQFHFHTPSEERIDGKSYPLVAHLVHKSAEGKLAVIAVLFRTGKSNAALRPVFASLPARAGDKHAMGGTINVGDLLPGSRDNYTFIGSLTTPPCSEDVRWVVMKTPVSVSSAQLAAFRKLYRMNARPVQAVNGREVLVGR
ncbi:Carbonic anhydrase [Cupriavidus laharis]|uniref:carbonic anhydrase n=1 Tax=Cupriavidus laharis TaxID=151654 RepID=A0ABM8XTU8_9BURK|nr:carbonic anhydrase family protein [Cupriavidus laharis]CAG9183773.1 Carbonic anhydrase [Cupriavidus laharis]